MAAIRFENSHSRRREGQLRVVPRGRQRDREEKRRRKAKEGRGCRPCENGSRTATLLYRVFDSTHEITLVYTVPGTSLFFIVLARMPTFFVKNPARIGGFRFFTVGYVFEGAGSRCHWARKKRTRRQQGVNRNGRSRHRGERTCKQWYY